MVLKEKNEDSCPWDFRGDEVTNSTVNFAMCYDCPMMEKLIFYPDHSVEVYCEKED